MPEYGSCRYGRQLYANPLTSAADMAGFVMEGDGAISFPQGRLRLENTRSPSEGQAANLVYWCPESFPDHIAIRWRFWPIRQPGLAILFFAAQGRSGKGVLDPELAPRNGIYDQYHHGDIDAYHMSYYRKSYPEERRLQLCNLRKSYGFHLVAQGADPLPSIPDCEPPYQMEIIKSGEHMQFRIEGIEVLRFRDKGQLGETSIGPPLGAGGLGLRQMAPLIAEYSDLEVVEAWIDE